MQMILLLRGFVVLGVMLMHTAWFFKKAPGGSWETLSVMLLDIISLFAVPLFMFISGYLFISRHSHADKYGIGFCRKMFLSVLSPYLLFSLMYIVGACWVNNDKYSLDEIITMIITGSAAVHLGFFRALFGFYIFYPLIIRCFRYCQKQKVLPLYFAAVIILQLLWKCWNNLVVPGQEEAYLVMALSFLRYIAYFSFGMAACLYRRRLLSWTGRHYGLLNLLLLIFIPAVAGCWFARYYLHDYQILEFICFPLNLFLYTILIAMIFYSASSWSKQNNFRRYLIVYLGNYSFGIFLLHIIFMYCGDALLTLAGITPDTLIFYPLLFCLMLMMSVVAMELIMQLPFYQYFIGKTDKVRISESKVLDLHFIINKYLNEK